MTLKQYFSTHSMSEFACALGVSVSIVSLWTSGKRPIPISRCQDIEALTGVPARRLRPDFKWFKSPRR